MQRKTLKTLLLILTVILALELIFVGITELNRDPSDPVIQNNPGQTQPSESENTEPSDTQPTDTTSTQPEDTQSTEPSETQPQTRFVLTFVGDCTLGSEPAKFKTNGSFVNTVGKDYDFPFRNVREYFENDDFTMINLEVVFADEGTPINKTFTFRGPRDYINILSGSSVEAVTLANNHSIDFGDDGYASTMDVLDEAEIAFAGQDETVIYVTEGGLKIGVYAAVDITTQRITKGITKLKNEGADVIIAALHWGEEGKYRPNGSQQTYAKAAIDAGADIVYGHHPHVLQKIEKYNGGIIYYSLGNFSFGGNAWPRDLDTAILQQEIIRDENGNVSLGELTIIPCSISSLPVQNNFQPTPYPEGSKEYDRVLSKLDGSFNGPDLEVNYNPTEPSETKPEETDPEETKPNVTEPPVTEPEETDPEETAPTGDGSITDDDVDSDDDFHENEGPVIPFG